jgi:hypothetical protein
MTHSNTPQIIESDGSTNTIADEPVRGDVIRVKPCIGCGHLPHGEPQVEINCYRAEIARLRGLLEQARGNGFCTVATCQKKAMVCADCAKSERINPPRPSAKR